MIRLQKFMANAGVASRRQCEELIQEGKVTVNGRRAELGMSVDPDTDRVEVSGRKISLPNNHIYVMLNKPAGCVSTCSDDEGRRTVLDYLDGVEERVYPVGRLDYNTEGLLLLTNDGDFANKMTHPRHSVAKKYLTVIDGSIDDVDVRRLESGVTIDGRRTAPAVVKVLHREPDRTELLVIIHEGRNRQIRKMFEAVGKHATYIKRVAVGSLPLGDLKRGQYRHLSAAEIDKLRHDAAR
ncbi:MAG: rRNA pseudouridine synthase [Clostridia bacterium]|nr:rRNA pseudouridine synthase [Clostridia bacterium]